MIDKNVSWYLNKQVEKVMVSSGKNNIKGIFVKDEHELYIFFG